MTVSVDKCSVTLLSNDVRDSEMSELSVMLYGSQLKRVMSPRFLGVTYDAGFTFRERLDLGRSDHSSVLCCRPREALAYWRWWWRVHLKYCRNNNNKMCNTMAKCRELEDKECRLSVNNLSQAPDNSIGNTHSLFVDRHKLRRRVCA